MITLESHQSNTFKEKLAVFDGIVLERIGNNTFFGNNRVHPEFENLMRLNFYTHTSIRFNKYSLKREHSEKQRYDFIFKTFKPLNFKIKLKFPELETGNHTLRYCWVNEFGASDDEVHIHILTHFKPDTIKEAQVKAYNYLKRLEMKVDLENQRYFDNRMGRMPIIQSMKTRKIKNQSGIVSYFCKIEKTRGRDNFKQIGYSMGFRSIIQNQYPNPSIQARLN
jgi:hypothetical protein